MKTEQFAVVESSFNPHGQIDLQIGFDFEVNLESKTLSCVSKIEFLADSKVFLLIRLRTQFVIQEESFSNMVVKGKVIIPVHLARHLAMIAIGSSRGVLFAKTESTIFSKFILPTINIQEFIKDDLVIA